MPTQRIIREKARQLVPGTVTMVRTALGQVAEYDVYLVAGNHRNWIGGGTKREAQRLFDRTA